MRSRAGRGLSKCAAARLASAALSSASPISAAAVAGSPLSASAQRLLVDEAAADELGVPERLRREQGLGELGERVEPWRHHDGPEEVDFGDRAGPRELRHQPGAQQRRLAGAARAEDQKERRLRSAQPLASPAGSRDRGRRRRARDRRRTPRGQGTASRNGRGPRSRARRPRAWRATGAGILRSARRNRPCCRRAGTRRGTAPLGGLEPAFEEALQAPAIALSISPRSAASSETCGSRG